MAIKKRGYTLIEMLIISAVLVVFIALSVRPVRIIAAEIPQSSKTFQHWITTTKAMKQLKADVEQSGRIIDLNDGILTLEHKDSQIVYTFSDEKISREVLPDKSKSSWGVPHVKINMQLWENDNGPYAVEITTWNQKIVSGRQQRRLRQSFVYFQKESGQAQ